MDKQEIFEVQLTAYDALFRTLLKTMPPEQFSEFSDNLLKLWTNIQIPKQHHHIQSQLTSAKEMCESLIKSAELERSR